MYNIESLEIIPHIHVQLIFNQAAGVNAILFNKWCWNNLRFLLKMYLDAYTSQCTQTQLQMVEIPKYKIKNENSTLE